MIKGGEEMKRTCYAAFFGTAFALGGCGDGLMGVGQAVSYGIIGVTNSSAPADGPGSKAKLDHWLQTEVAPEHRTCMTDLAYDEVDRLRRQGNQYKWGKALEYAQVEYEQLGSCKSVASYN